MDGIHFWRGGVMPSKSTRCPRKVMVGVPTKQFSGRMIRLGESR